MDTLITATKTILPLLGVALVAGFLFTGCSHRKMFGPHHNWAENPENPEKLEAKVTKHTNKMLDEAEATDDQRIRVHGIKDRLLADFLAMGKEKRAVHDEIRAAWKSDRLDTERLHGLVDGKSDSMKDFGHKVVEAVAELHEVFTPEQRDKISQLIEKHCQH